MEEAFDLSLFGGESLPLVVRPKKKVPARELSALLRAHSGALHEKLLQNGGLLFRGFDVQGPDDFAGVVEALAKGPSVRYIGGDSPRNRVTGSIYTSTEAPSAVKIPLHNELSFVRHHPKHIFFYCDVAPSHEGETIIGDARRIYDAIDPDVRRRFIDRQISYVSCYYGKSLVMAALNALQPSHKSWHDVFETESRAEVERLCREYDFSFEWHDENWIRISQTRPAARTHPETNEWVWFCQPHLYDFNPRLLGLWRYVGAKLFYARRHTRLHEVFYGDGGKLPRRDLYHLLDVLDRNTVAFPWQRGDVLVLDNILTMHGRATFTGKRRILAAMTS